MKKRCVPLALGGILLFFFLVAAVFPAAFTSYGQKEMFAPWLTPSPAHLLGTNALGYDIFTELVYGTRQTLLIGVLCCMVFCSIRTVTSRSVCMKSSCPAAAFGQVLRISQRGTIGQEPYSLSSPVLQTATAPESAAMLAISALAAGLSAYQKVTVRDVE